VIGATASGTDRNHNGHHREDRNKEATMIVHRTFSRHRGWTSKGMRAAQEEARAEAESFINRELNEDDVVAITESALPSTCSFCLVSVTVWYRKR
jgi:hypothetical protein